MTGVVRLEDVHASTHTHTHTRFGAFVGESIITKLVTPQDSRQILFPTSQPMPSLFKFGCSVRFRAPFPTRIPSRLKTSRAKVKALTGSPFAHVRARGGQDFQRLHPCKTNVQRRFWPSLASANMARHISAGRLSWARSETPFSLQHL